MENVLITGGTGFIGSAMAELYPPNRVTIFSRHEEAQVEMKTKHPNYSYVVGDVRDYNEIYNACENIDYVYHFAALKHVNICEEQPQAAIKTNVFGTMNVINACKERGIRLVNMSSDKAINPDNAYGITKAMAEKMVAQEGFTNIRSGNVLWSTGSVLPIWKEQIKKKNEINITSADMTRFFVSVSELVYYMLEHKDFGGTYTIPMKSFSLSMIAEEFIKRYGNKSTKLNVVGLRPGERLHEYRNEKESSEFFISNDLSYIFDGKV